MKNLGFSKKATGSSDNAELNSLKSQVYHIVNVDLNQLGTQITVLGTQVSDNHATLQQQIDYINQAELPQFVRKNDFDDHKTATENEIASAKDELDAKIENVKTTAVVKGENGTWAENPTRAVNNCFEPVVIGYYTQDNTRQNRPSGYGSLHSFSSIGSMRKQGGNWITTLAFSTDERIFFVQSINGGQGGWNEIASNKSRTVQIQSDGIQAGQNLTNRSVTANGFIKKWAEMTATTPSNELPIVINHPFNRNKIVNMSYRIDGDNSSVTSGLSVEIYDNHFKVILQNQNYANRPVTFFVEHKP